MSVFSVNEFDQHELVVFRNEEKSGLQAIIAIHNTNLGPALGGCRIYPYANSDDALTDVLRLSRSMTYKSALAGLPLGGGKSVIIADPATDKTPALLHAMGKFIESLDGQYISAEDSGTSVDDLKVISEKTRYVTGIKAKSKYHGDPSPSTAYGVFKGIQAAVKYKLGLDELTGISVAIQGAGNVGYYLAEHLAKAGARLFVADINEHKASRAVKLLGAIPIAAEDIIGIETDIFSPCAMGAAINDDTIGIINASIVAGAANNQLAAKHHAQMLHSRNILYAPDFVINAGGVIDAYYQYAGKPRYSLINHIEKIGHTLTTIFQRADVEGKTTNDIAELMATEKFYLTGVNTTDYTGPAKISVTA